MPAKRLGKDAIHLMGPELGDHVRVKYKDVFDMKAFYTDLHDYLLELEWKSHDGAKETWETYYGERIDQSGAREIWIWWRLSKKAPGAKITYYLDFDWHCIAIQKAEIIKDGKKLKINKGEMELILRAHLGLDFMKGLRANPVLKYFADLIKQRVYHSEIEQRKKEIYQELYSLQNWIKQWFKLKRYLPYEEEKSFYPSVAFPSHQKD
jgi:hypothetical protein